jgi:hypothetical protein
MLADGFYTATYAARDRVAHAMLVFRAGTIVGIDEHGGQYDGTYAFDATRNLTVCDVVLTVADGVRLITGRSFDHSGAKVRLVGEMPTPQPVARFSLDLAGRAVDVALRCIRPLDA